MRGTRPVTLASALALAMGLAADASAQSSNVIRVEEDWELVVGVPDPAGNAPQIITAISSTELLEDVHAVFELNHVSQPGYVAGGMQLQVWSGDYLLDVEPSNESGVLATGDEVVRWTMKMSYDDGDIRFDVDDGTSATWGGFGNGLYTTIAATQPNLSRYTPETSVANSYVGYAGHRVKKLTLKRVRYYSSNGLVSTDTTERVVHHLED